ncbi:hypothetical protein J437_LFUL011234 [Ladona fulva]|uniref:EB domain-containing protein n=1 Tax=Ladona fulva TaxID=123851 RepID=A0A8K0P4S3_LADFU|nr:hypothetical protein J437_LFUL011234 [Ladona fulva]
MKPVPERFLFTASLIIMLASVSLCSDSTFADDKKCTGDPDCTKYGLSHCDKTKGVCICDVGCVEDSTGKCVHAKLGSSCSGPDSCKYVEHGVCKSDVCVCEEGYIGNKEGDVCTMGQLNDTCTNDVDCKNVENAQCAKTECDSKDGCKVCSCKVGFRADETNSVCLKLIDIGNACDESKPQICGLFASCTNGTCICDEGYKKKNNIKYDCKGGIHEICTSKSDCFDKYAVCKSFNNTSSMLACECPKEHPLKGDHCSAGTTAFSTFSVVGAVMALATKMMIS